MSILDQFGNPIRRSIRSPILRGSGGSPIDPDLSPDNPNLLAMYTDNTSGALWLDDTPNGRNADIGDIATVVDGVADLNPDGFIRFPSTVWAANMHWMGWVWLDQNPAAGQIIIYSDYGFSAAKRSFEVLSYHTPQEMRVQVSDDGGAAEIAGNGIPNSQGVWYFVDAFCDNTEIGIAVNNAAHSATPHTGGVFNSGVPKYLGARDTNADGNPNSNYANIKGYRLRFFNGKQTDEVRTKVFNEGSPA